MALFDIGMRTVSQRLPKVVSPKTHAIIDYASVGMFAVMGALVWKRHKRAAISSWFCGAQQLTLALLTDFPGGVAKVVSYDTHLKIDAGFAGIVGVAPNLTGFSDEWPSVFFRVHGMAIAAETGMSAPEPEDWRTRRAA